MDEIKDTEIKKPAARTRSGTFKKGVSGNPSGRPKKSTVLSSDFRAKLAKFNTIDEKIEYLLDYLITNSKDEETAFRYVKEMLPYFKPKLKNIENHTTEDKTITIQWMPPQVLENKEKPKIVDHKN